MGQHHGLPTALLDWTRSPLVAAFFAVEKAHAHDGAIYAVSVGKLIDPHEGTPPQGLAGVSFVMPAHVTPRMAAQSSVFSFHADPQSPFTDPAIHKIRISAAMKVQALDTLETYGIHAASLFPGLDGVSSHIRYLKGFAAPLP